MADDDNCLVTNFVGGQDVVISGWMFCAPHGLEWCHKCTVDHRSTNNVQIEDELTEDQMELLTDYGLEDFADREQVKVTNLWKKLPGDRVGCKAHSAVGCSSCFNFKQQLLDRLPALQAKADAMMAEFNARRQQQRQQQQQAGSGAGAGPSSTQADAAAAAPAGDEERCRGCGKPDAEVPGGKLLKCLGCNRAKYCLASCQRDDWPGHKPQCKQWAAEAKAGKAAKA